MIKKRYFKEQLVPLILTVITFILLCFGLYLFILLLNYLPSREKIVLELRLQDVLVGLTIYLKTAIDFAIFIGNLMRSNPGWRSRIAIEGGTAAGNALGTLAILLIWNFFREVPILMAIMIFVASLVLLRMAEESFHSLREDLSSKHKYYRHLLFIEEQIKFVNRIFRPLLRKIIPNLSITNIKVMPFFTLFSFSFTIPFILGLDDFAGYIPLFSIINVYGFAVGIFLGHMILNLGLFINPKKTVELVRAPLVLVVGGVAFVGIAAWGFYEAIHLLLRFLNH